MNINQLSTQLLFTTVPLLIEGKDTKRRLGTGFFFNAQHPQNTNLTIPLLVTNYHVIKDANRGICQIAKADSDGMPVTKDKLKIEFDSKILSTAFIDKTLDIAAVPIAHLFRFAESQGHRLFFRAVDQSLIPDSKVIDELSAIEEITFIGYPGGIVDTTSGLPIVRQGITATPIWSDFQDQPKFLIDAGVFPGSSGSPVFVYNQGSYTKDNAIVIGSRVLFVGLITETMLHQEESGKAFLGLGKVVNATAFKGFIDNVVANVPLPP